MRVAYILRGPYGALGGAASYMVPEHVRRYATVRVLACDPPDSEDIIIYSNDEVDVVNIFSDRKKDILFNAYQALVEFSPDIVHVFQGPKCLYYLYSLCSLFPEAKWVLDIRTQVITTDKLLKKKRRKTYFYAQLFVEHIFGQSRNTIGDSLPVRLRPFTEEPIGLNLEKFSPRSFASNTLPSKFLFVGVLAKVRQIDKLLRAFNIFQKQRKSNCTLDLVGGGESMKDLELLVTQNNMKGINFLGIKTQPEVNQLMSHYDVGIAYVPNGIFEWAPSLKSIEYAAGGLPILASDTKGHRDYEKRFGFEFNYFSNTIESICEALDEISSRSSFDKEVSNNLVKVKRFDWEHIVETDVLPVYKKLLSN